MRTRRDLGHSRHTKTKTTERVMKQHMKWQLDSMSSVACTNTAVTYCWSNMQNTAAAAC